MTRVARRHDAINLAQGFPDFAAPQLLKDAACKAIQADVNQYAITWGTPALRTAIARKYLQWYGMTVDRDREVTVTCGATEAMAAVMLATVDPGDEVVVLEPFYENYGPDAVLCQAAPVFVPLEPPAFRLDPERLGPAITRRTRAIVINTPNNPSGRVFDQDEMRAVAELCIENDILAITDEIYEHIVYEGEHIPLAALPGMRERTITISGLSTTFSPSGLPPRCRRLARRASTAWGATTTTPSGVTTGSVATSSTRGCATRASCAGRPRARTTSWPTSRHSAPSTTRHSATGLPASAASRQCPVHPSTTGPRTEARWCASPSARARSRPPASILRLNHRAGRPHAAILKHRRPRDVSDLRGGHGSRQPADTQVHRPGAASVDREPPAPATVS